LRNGYGGDPDMVRLHIPEMADALYFGHAGNRGDAVRWGEADIAALSDGARSAFRRDAIGLIFQDYLLFEELTPRANAGLAGAYAPRGLRADIDARAGAVLERLGIGARGRRDVSSCSVTKYAPIGVRLSPRWAVEASWEHFSHRQLFSETNPGIDHLGIRLIHQFGTRR